jgi:adenylate kinase
VGAPGRLGGFPDATSTARRHDREAGMAVAGLVGSAAEKERCVQRYVVMGPQGCGKGTQASMLAAELGVPHVGTGDLFRRAAAAGDELGRRVGPLMLAGALVPDDLTIALVEARLADADCRPGFVLDGFPRNRAQASFLLDRWRPETVVLIEVPDEVVVARVLARRHCADCGRDHNLLLLGQPAARCGACGGPLTRRPDDTPAAVRRRLADYHRETAPALDLFRERGLLITVDGARDPASVGAAIRAALARSTPAATGSGRA